MGDFPEEVEELNYNEKRILPGPILGNFSKSRFKGHPNKKKPPLGKGKSLLNPKSFKIKALPGRDGIYGSNSLLNAPNVRAIEGEKCPNKIFSPFSEKMNLLGETPTKSAAQRARNKKVFRRHGPWHPGQDPGFLLIGKFLFVKNF